MPPVACWSRSSVFSEGFCYGRYPMHKYLKQRSTIRQDIFFSSFFSKFGSAWVTLNQNQVTWHFEISLWLWGLRKSQLTIYKAGWHGRLLLIVRRSIWAPVSLRSPVSNNLTGQLTRVWPSTAHPCLQPPVSFTSTTNICINSAKYRRGGCFRSRVFCGREVLPLGANLGRFNFQDLLHSHEPM